MQTKASELRSELKRQIDRDSRYGPWMLILATIALPILEGILVNLWTGAQMTGPAGICLAVIAAFHLLVGGMIIWQEFRSKSPLRILADAAELADCNCSTQRELDRRVLLYRMFRDSIETMNNQVCSLQGNPESFERTLRPVLKRFLDSICDTLGVCSNRYTLEVYLSAGVFAGGHEHPQVCGYRLAFFESPTMRVEQAVSMDTMHPLCLASAMDREKIQGRVSADSAVFNSQGQKTYFEQYATHMIPTQCGTGHLGFVVFTTPQTNPIADDALETLGLLASIISTFHSRWLECENQRVLQYEVQTTRQQMRLMTAHQVGRPVPPQRPQPPRPQPPTAPSSGAGLIQPTPSTGTGVGPTAAPPQNSRP